MIVIFYLTAFKILLPRTSCSDYPVKPYHLWFSLRKNSDVKTEPGTLQCWKCRVLPALAAFSTLPTQMTSSEKAGYLPFLANSDLGVMLLFLMTFFCNSLGQIELERLLSFVYIRRSGDLILICTEWRIPWPHISFMKSSGNKRFHEWP